MQAAIDRFNAKLIRCMNTRDTAGIKALNMQDDITGWGLYPNDIHEHIDTIDMKFDSYKAQIESTKAESTPVLALWNDKAVCLVCDYSMTHTLQSGQTLSQPDLRLSWFLCIEGGELKIRHGHLSQGVPRSFNWTGEDIPARFTPDTGSPDRLSGNDLVPFQEQLDKRTQGFATKDIDLLLSLNSYDSALYWGPLDQPVITSKEEHLNRIQDVVKQTDSVIFSQPVVFQRGTLACMTAYATITCKEAGPVSPVRTTFFLQQEPGGQWLTHHGHLSVPIPQPV
ncbi:nuclear transport factor 2 family protein [Spongorhabdus nitratireducens]